MMIIFDFIPGTGESFIIFKYNLFVFCELRKLENIFYSGIIKQLKTSLIFTIQIENANCI